MSCFLCPHRNVCVLETLREQIPFCQKMPNPQNVGDFRPDCSYGLELLIELEVWKIKLFLTYAAVLRIQVFWQTSEAEHSSNKAAFHCISETLLSLPSPFSWHSLLPQRLYYSADPSIWISSYSAQHRLFMFRREDQSLILLRPSRALSAFWSKWGKSLMTTSLFKA